ncbi:MAG: helix-turn-helix domain-containing protein [Bacteroidales bacterium]|nr:helix-turn-helix domain-containing protein [Bacteroidales bacterium]
MIQIFLLERHLRTFVMTFLFLFSILLQAQQPRIADVTCSLFDTEGCWWYGTQGGGLCRDDGRQITVWRSDRDHPDLLGSNDVTCLAESTTEGAIWFGTKKGAYVLTKHNGELFPLLPDELADKRLNCMMEGSDGHMWVAYRHTLFEVDANTHALLRRFETSWQNRQRSVVALAQDRSGTIWISLWNGGVSRLQRGHSDFIPLLWQRDDYCTQLQFDTIRSCIVAVTSTGDRLKVHSDGTGFVPDVDMNQPLQQVLIQRAPRRDSTLLAYAEAPDSTYYIGTYHSLFRYVLPLDTLVRLPFETGRVRGLATASDGTLYFISKEMGLCRLHADSAEVLTAGSNLRSLELRGDTLLWLTDGLGNASTYNLLTGQLTLINQPESQSPPTNYWWLWLLLLIPAVVLPYYVYSKRKDETQTTTDSPDNNDDEDDDLPVADRELLDRATSMVLSHISDPDYSVDALASDLCMSRAALYRRLRQANGQTPTDFLRNIRLDRAAELLRTTDRSVNEVADLVGFSYASYFTRCFKERFGVAPKDYR